MDITAQQNELRRLLNSGIPFELSVSKKIRKSGFLGFFKKKIKITEIRKFIIKEPTLQTLDKIALEALKINEKGLEEIDNIGGYIKKQRYYKTMAKIIAIAVAQNEDEEQELEDIFFKTLKPSDLKMLVDLTDIASNMPDFINSILSVAAVKTERIENQVSPDLNRHTDLEE